jgi:anti-sigma B factor antagonist
VSGQVQTRPKHRDSNTWLTCAGGVRYNGPVSDARSNLSVSEVTDRAGDAIILAVEGELDLATIGTLKDAAGPRLQPDAWLVLDLSALAFCDSTGLGAFVALHRQATSVGATFALAGPGKRIADLFTLSGIDQVVPVFPTRGEALTAQS